MCELCAGIALREAVPLRLVRGVAKHLNDRSKDLLKAATEQAGKEIYEKAARFQGIAQGYASSFIQLVNTIPGAQPAPTDEATTDPGTDAVHELCLALHLYTGHNLDGRGPLGCVMNAIKALRPDVYEAFAELGFDGTYAKFFGEEDEPATPSESR